MSAGESDDDRAKRLFDEGAPLVPFLAKRLARGLGGVVDVDDLVAVGNAALLAATKDYDPSRSKLATYARRRITWAMLDHVRSATHGRSAAALALSFAERFVEGHLEAGADDREADATDAYPKRLASLLEGEALALALPFLTSSPDPVLTPEERAASAELSDRVWREVSTLDVRERALIERHYRDGEPFDRVAKDLGISKSWASRLHSSALAKLAKALKRSL